MDYKFYFRSEAVEGDALRVSEFEGEEGISQPFRFDIQLFSGHADIDLDAVLRAPAYLDIETAEMSRRIHGVLAEFEQLEQGPVHVHYRAVLVPRLWLLTLRRQNQVHSKDPESLDFKSGGLTVDKIIEKELKDAGFGTEDFEISLQEFHPVREYVVQYQETDLAFLSRLMEHEGVFYYFTHQDDRDKLIVADKNERFEDQLDHGTLIYRDPRGMAEPAPSVFPLRCRHVRVPREVMLRDYNWRTPGLDLTVTETVEDEGKGLICEYGAHYKETEMEGATLARIRAEEIRCRRRLYEGGSNCAALQPGHLYALDEHYRDGFNQKYLVTRVHHRGGQSSAGVSGLPEDENRPAYRNTFVSIPADVPYRPERRTPKPKIQGVVNAKIDSAGSGEYAEIDELGRYKVALPFDQGVDFTTLASGGGSRWVRKAEPYSGSDYGMHFPLHRGAEVLITHVDGDPDRPVIAAAVPNVETHTPVDEEDSRKNVLRTAAGNVMELDDTAGQEGFLMTNRSMGAVRQMRARPRKLKK
jgi:type VI secretion system secreted protein VgrG